MMVMKPQIKLLSTAYVNKILGTKFIGKQIITNLEKMGYDAVEQESDIVSVSIPAWRSDILHDIDLVEDVAIGYGYDVFEKTLPDVFTFGRHLVNQHLRDNLRTIMIGFGFNEVTTFTITNELDEFDKLGLEKADRVQLLNPINEEYTCIRSSLIPSLLKILVENKHHNLPQQIFELGIIVDETYKNTYHLGGVRTSAKTHFTESKSLVEGILRDIGLSSFDIIERDHSAFVNGRCASVKNDDLEIGYFGELHPKTILQYDLEHPLIAFEIFIDALKQSLPE